MFKKKVFFHIYFLSFSGYSGTQHIIPRASIIGMPPCLTINLYKTNHRRTKPIICVGNKYWNSLKDWFIMNQQDFPNQYVSLISEDLDEIIELVKKIEKTSINL